MSRTTVALVLFAPILSVAAEPKTRTFKFTYETTVTGLDPGQEARIWLPVPRTTDDQEVLRMEKYFLTYTDLNNDPKTGNMMFYLVAKADAGGNIPLKAVYTVRRKEVK